MNWSSAGHICLREPDWQALAQLPKTAGVQVFRFEVEGRTLWFLSTHDRMRNGKWSYDVPFCLSEPEGSPQFVRRFEQAARPFCRFHEQLVQVCKPDMPMGSWKQMAAFSLGMQLAHVLKQRVFSFALSRDYENVICVHDPESADIEVVLDIGCVCRFTDGEVRIDKPVPEVLKKLGVAAVPPLQAAKKVGAIQHALNTYLGAPLIGYEGLLPPANRLTLVAKRWPSGKIRVFETPAGPTTAARSTSSRRPQAVDVLDYPVRGIMPRLIDDYLLLSEFDNKTVILDMTAWPPKRVLERDVYCLWARQAGDGRWSLLARQDERDFGLLLLRSSRHRGEWYFLKQGSHKIDLKWSAFLGTELLVAGDKKQPPYFFRDGDFVPVANLPASVHAHPGLVRLESGKMFFLWNKALYEYQRKGFVQIPNLKISDSFLTWTSVPRENDSFFYLSGRKLFEYRSRTKPVRHGPWKNLIHVRAGPKRSILVEDAVSPQGDIAKLYFPKEESVLLIPPHAFGLPEAGVSDFVCWAPRGDRIVCGQHGKLRAVPAEHVLGFDRKPV